MLEDEFAREEANRDQQENTELELPSGEHLAWPVFWLGDVYGPSTVRNLIAGLESLGLDRGAEHSYNGWNAVTWLAANRAGISGGQVLICPWLVPLGGSTSFRTLPTGLPDGVAYARLTLVKLGPSTTACVAAFIPSKRAQDSLRSELNRPARSADRAIGHDIVAWESVTDVRRRRLRESESALRHCAAMWMSERFAGVFATLDGVPQPAMELKVTEKLLPLVRGDQEEHAQAWSFVAGLEGWESGYLCEPFPGMRLRPPDEQMGDRPVYIAGGRRSEMEKIPLHEEPLEEMDPVVPRVRRSLAILVSRITLVAALRRIDERLANVRDAGSRAPDDSPQALKRLQDLRHSILPLIEDGESLADDARRLSDTQSVFDNKVPVCPLALDHPRYGLLPQKTNEHPHVEMSGPKRAWTLNESLREEVLARSRGLQPQARRVQQNLQLDAELLQASANLKLQVGVGRATKVALAVSVLSLLVAGVTLLNDLGNGADSAKPTDTPTTITPFPTIFRTPGASPSTRTAEPSPGPTSTADRKSSTGSDTGEPGGRPSPGAP